MYHRGLGNATAQSRPALIFRYDRRETPPPGVGLFGSLAHTVLAVALHVSSATAVAAREGLVAALDGKGE